MKYYGKITESKDLVTKEYVDNSQKVINDGTLTMQVNGTQKATFSANQSGNATFNVTAADLGFGIDSTGPYIESF